jgi:hypothetical protein
MKNDVHFEDLGTFEELIDLRTARLLGTRSIKRDPSRPFGHAGAQAFQLTESITLQRGHRTVAIRASKAKPIPVSSMTQMLCGKQIR